MSQSHVETPPALFGYQILTELSRDRLGVLYHAKQVLYRREVALRLVDDRARAGIRDLTEVCRAAEHAGQHHHPALLKLFEISENEGQFYIAEEVPPGPSLRERLGRGPLPPEEGAKLIATVARGLAHLHENGCQHLGVTSGNVYLSGESPAVGDIGVSGLLHSRTPYVGDPAYAAPEQLSGGKADPRSDVFALGRVLLESVTGKSPTETAAAANVPAHLARIIKMATDPSPSRRYSNAAALADELDRFTRGETAPAPGPMSGVGDWLQANPALAMMTAALALVVSAAGGLLIYTMGQASRAKKELIAANLQLDEALMVAAKVPAVDEGAMKAATLRVSKAEKKATLAEQARDREHKFAVAQEKARQAANADLELERKDHGITKKKVELAQKDVKAADDARPAVARTVDRLHVGHGTALMDAGDLSGALVPYARALMIANYERLPEDAHRLRIAALLSRLPRPTWVQSFKKKNDVTLARLSPAGDRVLIAEADGVATVYTALGKEVGNKVTHGALVTQAVFSPDGKRVVTANARGNLRVFRTDDGKDAFEPVTVTGAISHLGFSADGKRFVAVVSLMGGGAEARVFDAASGDQAGEAIAADVTDRPAALSPDGSKVVVCAGREARIYDVKMAKQVGPALEHGGDLTSAAFSADGRLILTAGGGVARVWVAATGKQAMPKLEHTGDIAPQFDESGRLVLTGGPSLRVTDTATGKSGPAFSAKGVRQAVLSADGRFVLLGATDGGVRIIDVSTGRDALPPVAHGASLEYVALSADGSRSMTFDGRSLRVWDLTAGEVPAPVAVAPEANVVYSSNGKRLAHTSDKSVQVHDTATGAAVGAALKHKGEVKTVVFSPAGDQVLTVANPDPAAETPTWDVRIWDAATGKPLSEPIEHLRDVSYAGFANEGRFLTVSLDKQVRLFDAKTGGRIGKALEHQDDVTIARVSPDGKYLLTCEKGGKLRAWKVGSNEQAGDAMTHTADVKSLVFDAGSKRLATLGEDGLARVFVLGTGKELANLEHGGAVTTAVFGPDARTLLTGCADGAARLWSVDAEKPLTPQLANGGPVRVVGFSEGGRWLLTAAGPSVRIWDATSGEPIGPAMAVGAGDVTAVSLSKANELVAVSAAGKRSARKLDSAEGHSVEILADIATALSGREEAGPGQLAAADARAVEKAWNRAATKHPSDFEPSRERTLTWARRGAAECEARGLWAGAERRLAALAEGSNDPELLARRARVLAELGRHEAAVADYGKAIEKASRWQWLAGRAASEAALRQWDRAAADLAAAAKLNDRDAGLWAQLGTVEAERGKWKEAAEALGKAVKFGSVDPAVWHRHALALLSSGDEKGYKAACERMLKKFAGNDEARRSLADACVLGPGAIADYKSLLAAAPASSDAGEVGRFAALLLRSGEPAKAAEALEKLKERARPADLWLLALAYKKANQADKAKAAQQAAAQAKERDGAPVTERQASALWKREAGVN